MRYSLLSFVVCPMCHGDLVCVAVEEMRAALADGLFPQAERVNAGPGVGPVPQLTHETPASSLLRRHASAAPVERALEFVVESGLLVCVECGRWFPIEKRLPELLPDHLRDADREPTLFATLAAGLPAEVRDALAVFTPHRDGAPDAGAHHKKAEITIKSKIDDPAFFGPGYSSPFNPWVPEFTLYLIRLFGTATSLLELRKGEALLDSGCGYAWTTEWLFKSGINVVGVDICRTYLEIGLQRIGSVAPHLVIGDVENLPIRTRTMDAVLAYESFHHLPDRNAALRGYDRVLKPDGRAVLAEPGGAHEHAEQAVDAMKKYGILEKGMELEDVTSYAAGTNFLPPEQVYVMKSRVDEFGAPVDSYFARAHSVFEGNLFRLVKGHTRVERGPRAGGTASRKLQLWRKMKPRIKAALLRAGLE